MNKYNKYRDFDGYKLCKYFNKYKNFKLTIYDLFLLRYSFCQRIGYYDSVLKNKDYTYIQIEVDRFNWMKQNNLLDKNYDYNKYCKLMRRKCNLCINEIDKMEVL